MNRGLLNSLTDAEWLLVAETERDNLDALDEDELVELHTRVRRARTKYVKLYRRQASARVGDLGGRGFARPKNRRNAEKAEVFEEALFRVSRRLAAVARESAALLRDERIAAARGQRPPARTRSASTSTPGPKAGRAPARRAANPRAGDRDLTSPVSRKKTASTRAAGARRQAKRDSR